MNRIQSDLKNIPIEKVQRNPENPRIVFRQQELDALLQSINKIGLQVPISVYKDGENYVIIDGERRWKTFLKLNYEKIPAIIQPKPTELENLLLMFNIHGLREQWDIFTIANKLTRIINLLRSDLGREPTEIELSAETGLSRGILRRCRLIIALPQRFKNIILTELEKPKKDQIFSEDFFLEMEGSLRAVSNNYPELLTQIDHVRDVLIKKRGNDIINNIIDFRKLTKIATSTRNVGYDAQKVRESLLLIFQDNNVSIESVFRNTVEGLYGDRQLESTANNFLIRITNISDGDLLDEDFRNSLLRIREKIDQLLK